MNEYQIQDLITFALILIFCVSFVATVMWFKKKENDNRTKVLLNALEKGQEINPELLAPKKQKKIAGNKWALLALLIGGCGMTLFGMGALIVSIVDTITRWGETIDGFTFGFNSSNYIVCVVMLAIGIALLIGYFVGKKLLKPEVEAEEAALAKK